MADDVRADFPQTCDPVGSPPVPRDWLGLALKAAFAALVAVMIWWVIWVSVDSSARHRHWAGNAIVPLSIFAAACLVVVRHERHWSRPVQRFQALLPKIRAGQAPIEQLSEIGGGLTGLMPLVQELLHEIRRQRLEVAHLNHEVQQRIANRTDALQRQVGSLRQQAARDALTGLYNRRMLELLLPKLIERCREERIELCLLMIDIDHFKPLNDSLGHTAGDELLRNVARIISSGIGDRDIAIRYGGDEFIVLMPGIDLAAAQSAATRLSTLVEQLTRSLRVQSPPQLSIGVAHLSEKPNSSPQDLLCTADRRLYEAKAARRETDASSTMVA